MAKRGIDVSVYQGNINWDMTKQDIDFAIIRCGYGGNVTTQDDRRWEANAKACERLKIPYGTYLYSYARSVEEAMDEADHVLRLIKNKKLEYPIYYDVEENEYINEVSNEQLVKQCIAFCDKIEKAGYYVGIYSSRYFLETRLNSNSLDRFDKWVAEWNPEPTYNKNFGMWQYTNNAKVSGIEGRVDADIAYLDYPKVIRSSGLNHLEKEDDDPIIPKPEPGRKTYIVKAGDNLSTIAQKYNTTVTRLVELNNIKNPNLIYPGQVLKLPTSTVEPTIYIVQRGDNLSKIAKKYNTTWKKIYERNKNVIGKNPNRIYAGQKLIIP